MSYPPMEDPIIREPDISLDDAATAVIIAALETSRINVSDRMEGREERLGGASLSEIDNALRVLAEARLAAMGETPIPS